MMVEAGACSLLFKCTFSLGGNPGTRVVSPYTLGSPSQRPRVRFGFPISVISFSIQIQIIISMVPIDY